jgi:hypothetical protein
MYRSLVPDVPMAVPDVPSLSWFPMYRWTVPDVPMKSTPSPTADGERFPMYR